MDDEATRIVNLYRIGPKFQKHPHYFLQKEVYAAVTPNQRFRS